MDGISIAASAKRRTPKELHHLELHPVMGGGVRVEAHHTSYEHPPESKTFGPDDHEGFYEHIARHTGRPKPEIAEHEESEPQSYEREKGIAK